MTVNSMKYAVSMTHHLVGIAEIAEMLGLDPEAALARVLSE